MRLILPVLLALAMPHAVLCQDSAPDYSGMTLTGNPLREPDWSDATREKLELDLEIARATMEVAPGREESWIWLGRRLGYLGRYPEAIAVFTKGLEKFPNSYKLYRFRGRHRARNRDFDGAVSDYQTGIEKMAGHPDSFEPDGMPNARGLTISTYRSNLHYYLGQTSFATRDYRRMIRELDLADKSPISLDIEDHRVAIVFWKYLAHMKLGETEQAATLLATIPGEIDLIENATYHNAVKVLQSVIPEDEAMQSDSLSRFALGMRLQFDGRMDEARRVLDAVVDDNALGYWPAEVELTGVLQP